MAITEKEKEALFAEFQARYIKTQGYASGYATMYNMAPAKDHFWERYHQMTMSYDFDIWSPHGINGSDWDLIRKLVCHGIGVSIVKDIPSDRLEAANRLAIQLIDLLFDFNEAILKEEDAAE